MFIIYLLAVSHFATLINQESCSPTFPATIWRNPTEAQIWRSLSRGQRNINSTPSALWSLKPIECHGVDKEINLYYQYKAQGSVTISKFSSQVVKTIGRSRTTVKMLSAGDSRASPASITVASNVVRKLVERCYSKLFPGKLASFVMWALI